MYEYLADNFAKIESEITDACKKAGRQRGSVRLITVTKTYPAQLAQAVINLGQLDIGENRPQEIVEKMPLLSANVNMHLIGQLQSNKVRKVIGLVKYVHSIDSLKLLDKIDAVAQELQSPTNILIQVNTSKEESKSGCAIDEAQSLCEAAASKRYAKFCGLMTIGPLSGDVSLVEKSFETLQTTAEKVKDLCQDKTCELSMGMSGDFALAIKHGATMIRVGTRLVGERNYNV